MFSWDFSIISEGRSIFRKLYFKMATLSLSFFSEWKLYYSPLFLEKIHENICEIVSKEEATVRQWETLWNIATSLVKAEYIVLYLNASTKLQNARWTSRHPVLMNNCPTCNHMAWPYQFTEWFVISSFLGVQGMRCGHENYAFWEESWSKIYAGKRTQKYSKGAKER